MTDVLCHVFRPLNDHDGFKELRTSFDVLTFVFLVVNLFFFFLDSNRSTTSTLNRFSALQQSGSLLSSVDSDRRVPHRYSRAANIIKKKTTTPMSPKYVMLWGLI